MFAEQLHSHETYARILFLQTNVAATSFSVMKAELKRSNKHSGIIYQGEHTFGLLNHKLITYSKTELVDVKVQ